MKVKILKKTIKEGVSENGSPYCIKSLFVSFTEESIYTKIVAHIKAIGGSDDKTDKFCSPNEYKGIISYAFGLGCSHFTFDRVERFGVLDANIVFSVNEKGFINAKIQVVDKKEQIIGYESPVSLQEEEVNGWISPAPEIKSQQPLGDGSHAEPNPIEPFGVVANSLNPQPNDLPF